MEKLIKILEKINDLKLELLITDTGRDVLEENDVVYTLKNEVMQLDLQIVEKEVKQYTIYPNVNFNGNSRKMDEIINNVSVCLLKDLIERLNNYIKEFDKQVEIVEKLLKDELKLVRHYDLTDRMYLGIK